MIHINECNKVNVFNNHKDDSRHIELIYFRLFEWNSKPKEQFV